MVEEENFGCEMALADAAEEGRAAVERGVAERGGDVAGGDDVLGVETAGLEVDEEAGASNEGDVGAAFLSNEKIIGNTEDGHFFFFLIVKMVIFFFQITRFFSSFFQEDYLKSFFNREKKVEESIERAK